MTLSINGKWSWSWSWRFSSNRPVLVFNRRLGLVWMTDTTVFIWFKKWCIFRWCVHYLTTSNTSFRNDMRTDTYIIFFDLIRLISRKQHCLTHKQNQESSAAMWCVDLDSFVVLTRRPRSKPHVAGGYSLFSVLFGCLARPIFWSSLRISLVL